MGDQKNRLDFSCWHSSGTGQNRRSRIRPRIELPISAGNGLVTQNVV